MKLFRLGITTLVFFGPVCCHRLAVLPRAFDTPATDEEWSNAICKGVNFLTAMKSSNKAAAEALFPGLQTAASQFQNIAEDVLDWGWGKTSSARKNVDYPYEIDEYREAAKQDDDDMTYVTYRHEKDYKKDGRDYKGTGAIAEIEVGSSGVLFAANLESPLEAARSTWARQPASGELPLLQRSSDLLWAAYEPEKKTGLRQCLSCRITNTPTQNIILRALGKKAGKWPGASFDIGSDEGLALLGSPNAAGPAYLLIQRKKELGNRCITKVTVFKEDNNPHPWLLFDIAECKVEYA
ncbi:hypothetical protein BDV95DRAFT_589502 [Massariosphaeria phaeospora]|uniref:Uncharacterized protein n=1 Tax=Massariosphaeria phaeospora TaxID=100035 RepID=A0A7C8IJA5_9PLEO|nr:hypothetical protein BDV95DRAFT_589502 [Massariosphaeria phaeospora]